MRTWTTESLLRFSSSYWDVCALHAAVVCDVFTPLAETPLNMAELAAQARLSMRGARALGTAICALGLAVREGDKLVLTDFARCHLARTSPEYLGDIILHHQHLTDGWTKLAEAAKEGRRMRPTNESSPETLAAFLKGMANMAIIRAREVAETLDLHGARSLMDLGGGPGSYTAAFCEQNPQLRAVIFDRATTKPFAMETVTQRGLADRVSFVSGDIVQDDLPGGFDVIWISHVLHGSSPEHCALMCRKACAALNPGGTVYIQEFYLHDTLDGPLFPALFNLNMLQGTDDGQAYTWQEVEIMLKDAGCVSLERLPSAKDPSIGIIRGTLAG